MNKSMMALLATASLTGYQIARLTGDQIASLTGDQIARLTGDQIASLTGDQIASLTGYQIARLTGDQIARLVERKADLKIDKEDVPSIPNLYSQILKGVKDETRVLDQATFGPDKPPANLCETPMCIAGHTVNVAGKKGYALEKRFGFAGAAGLIHAASRPDISQPRYDSYPNEWALAYIEQRAKEEPQLVQPTEGK